jgi:hypothetical protein
VLKDEVRLVAHVLLGDFAVQYFLDFLLENRVAILPQLVHEQHSILLELFIARADCSSDDERHCILAEIPE